MVHPSVYPPSCSLPLAEEDTEAAAKDVGTDIAVNAIVASMVADIVANVVANVVANMVMVNPVTTVIATEATKVEPLFNLRFNLLVNRQPPLNLLNKTPNASI